MGDIGDVVIQTPFNLESSHQEIQVLERCSVVLFMLSLCAYINLSALHIWDLTNMKYE